MIWKGGLPLHAANVSMGSANGQSAANREEGKGVGGCPLARAPRLYLRCAPTKLRLRRISALTGDDPLPERSAAWGEANLWVADARWARA
ncbi:MAG: hypothetical protein C0494_10080 [Sphingobium sp.]|nr:hypothetical protein [Sphingobium sp.]